MCSSDLPPNAANTSEYGSPSSRRGPSSADKPTVMSLPGSLRRAVTPSTAPPVERQVVSPNKRFSAQPALGATEATVAAPAGVPTRMSPLRTAAVAGIAFGVVLGIGGGLLFALGKSNPETVAAAPPIVVESVTPQASPPPAALPMPITAPTPVAAPAPSANELATAATPVTRTPTPAATATATAATKPPIVAAPAKQAAGATADKMQERLEWLEQDLKTKPAPKPAAKPPTKPRNGAANVGSGLAF